MSSLCESAGKQNVSVAIHFVNVAGHTVEIAGETPDSTKWVDRSLTAVDANKEGCTHKQKKSVREDSHKRHT